MPDKGNAIAQDPVADLRAILDAQRTVYGHLLELAHERHSALIAADATRLTELAEHEQPLLSRVRRLESARVQLVGPWAASLHLRPEDVTVSRLVEIVPPAAGATLLAARDRLLDVVQAVDGANQRNAQLLESCLASVNDSVQHLLQAVQLDPRYAQSGTRAGHEAGPRLTDVRA